jgi:hypothetical protein
MHLSSEFLPEDVNFLLTRPTLDTPIYNGSVLSFSAIELSPELKTRRSMMKIKGVVGLGALLVGVVLVGSLLQQWVATRSANSDRMITRIEYVRDGAKGPCFATGWNGASSGGLVFTYVPCEIVPTDRPVRTLQAKL